MEVQGASFSRRGPARACRAGNSGAQQSEAHPGGFSLASTGLRAREGKRESHPARENRIEDQRMAPGKVT
jgi:hypothetical protein